jgi:hypothetical protein
MQSLLGATNLTEREVRREKNAKRSSIIPESAVEEFWRILLQLILAV